MPFLILEYYIETILLPSFFAAPKMCEYVGPWATIYYVGHSVLPGWEY